MTASPTAVGPAEFRRAVARLDVARLRTEVEIGPLPAPARLAPWSHALSATLYPEGSDEETASGRMILLYDPAGVDAWGGSLRIVVFATCELDTEIAQDPLLPEVAWSWLTEALDGSRAGYSALGGTVTATSSTRFGDIAGPQRADDLELRASWTADERTELHLQAFAEFLRRRLAARGRYVAAAVGPRECPLTLLRTRLTTRFGCLTTDGGRADTTRDNKTTHLGPERASNQFDVCPEVSDNGDAERLHGRVGGPSVSSSIMGTSAGGVGIAIRRVDESQSTHLLPAQRSPLRDAPLTPLRMATILVIDPDRATREPLRMSLAEIGIGRILEAPSVAAVEDLVARQIAGDLALVSLQLGPEAGRLVHALREAGWPRVIALAPTADIGPVIDAIGAGVSGVLIGRRANPASASIPSTIHDLSTREIEVIRLVADGRSNKWIGEQLSLSALTVKSHLARIGRKLGTGDRAHMVALAMRAGVIS